MAASFVRAKSSLLWHSYVGALERRPLLTKIATGVLGTVLGDSIAQHAAQHMLADQQRRRATKGDAVQGAAPAPTLSSPPPSSSPSPSPLSSSSAAQQQHQTSPAPAQWRYDWLRTARLCAYSALLGTPIAHYWFGLLDRGALLPASVAAAPRAAAAFKTALDQLLMAPLGLTLFFASVSAMEGKTPTEAAASIRGRMKPALQANYLLWPAAQIVNFSFVPPQQRVLYVNCVAVFWCAILSHLAAGEAGGGGSREGGETPPQRRHHLHLPLPVPPEAPAAVAAAAVAGAGAAGGGGGLRRRGAGQQQQKQQQQKQQQQQRRPGEGEQPPLDTFVPVVP